jgi:hypothetical protein
MVVNSPEKLRKAKGVNFWTPESVRLMKKKP